MRTARICEKWDMALPDATVLAGPDWFLDWVLRSPRQAGIHLTAGWHAYASLLSVYSPRDIRSAREYFGGIGAQSLMIEELFSPLSHVVLDYVPEAVSHLRRVTPWNTIALVADAYDPRSTGAADLVGLDFGDLTVWKATQPGNHRDLLDRVFLLGPKAVVLTDIAASHLHLQRERYETVLGGGTCGDYPSYLDAFSRLIEERYGYVMVAGFAHRWSTVMALVPVGAAKRGVFIPTPDRPVGLELR